LLNDSKTEKLPNYQRCQHYLRGGCQLGEVCSYMHPPPDHLQALSHSGVIPLLDTDFPRQNIPLGITDALVNAYIAGGDVKSKRSEDRKEERRRRSRSRSKRRDRDRERERSKSRSQRRRRRSRSRSHSKRREREQRSRSRRRRRSRDRRNTSRSRDRRNTRDERPRSRSWNSSSREKRKRSRSRSKERRPKANQNLINQLIAASSKNFPLLATLKKKKHKS